MTVRSTPTIPSGGVFSAYAASDISASPAKIYNTIINTETWPDWSTFVPSVKITGQPSDTDAQSTRMVVGTNMTFTVQMNKLIKTSSNERVNIISDPPQDNDPAGTKYTVNWILNGTPGFILRAERVNEITKLEDGTSHYESWETMAGPAAYAVNALFGTDLQNRFKDWSRDLKAYTERS